MDDRNEVAEAAQDNEKAELATHGKPERRLPHPSEPGFPYVRGGCCGSGGHQVVVRGWREPRGAAWWQAWRHSGDIYANRCYVVAR